MRFTVTPPLLSTQHLQVWDIIPGDIHVIKPATRSLRCYRIGITYRDSYCTVENSNTRKIIREYQAHGSSGEDVMDFKVSERYPVPCAVGKVHMLCILAT